MASSSGGVGLLVVLGLVAIGMAGGSLGDDTDDSTSDDATIEFDSGSGDCDEVVVQTESVEGSGGQTSVESTAVADCSMSEGNDDEQAVRTLQNALKACNGQDIVVDGEYGPQTTQAVRRVQQQHGLAADGTYTPSTGAVMQWPATTESGEVTCVSDVQTDSASDG